VFRVIGKGKKLPELLDLAGFEVLTVVKFWI
jgi:hypothetical protein